MKDRFLPGVPGEQIEAIYNAAPGKEIASGKFDSPESSAALAANTFGFFLNRQGDLPPLPGCEDAEWPATSLALEKEVRFPWKSRWGHPVLDVVTTTSSALIGVESKRFEPYRDKPEAHFTDTYWRAVWGNCMNGYQRMRDTLHENESLFAHLKADQLVKHALGLWARTRPGKEFAGLNPILFYLYAEPDFLPNSNKPIDDEVKSLHRQEIAKFAASVKGDEVRFVACSYRELLATWERSENPEIREHARAVMQRFSP
ncbi:MAG: hypothetical protein OXK79_04495 [Chloroflexota bacterium]|nr:hypothetical protein [Chloroflexota bacterium]